MSIEHHALRALVAIASALALGGCGNELAPAWEIRAFRLFGAKIENVTRQPSDPGVTEAAPGEQVRLTLSYVDPAPTARPINVTWVFCAEATVMGTTFGCTARGVSVLTGTTVTYEVPRLEFSVDPSNRPRIQAIAIACAGGTVVLDPTTRQPRCQGEGSESWVMTRSLLVRTAETVAPNHNPTIDRVSFIRSGLTTADAVTVGTDTPLRVPRCTTDPCPQHTLDVSVAMGSREIQPTFDLQGNRVMTQERLQFGFFTDKGTMENAFRVDSAQTPDGPNRNRWMAPRVAGPVRFVFTAQDTRGGFDVVERTVVVE
jgi:hypothetical protein